MSTPEEIDSAVEILSGGGALYLLQCTSAYPVKFEDVHLRVMRNLTERYAGKIAGVGFSGHHRGIAVDSAAVAMGAHLIERHFTLDRTFKGTDHAASLEPGALRKLVRDVRAVEQAMGQREKELLPCELPARKKLRGN